MKLTDEEKAQIAEIDAADHKFMVRFTAVAIAGIAAVSAILWQVGVF